MAKRWKKEEITYLKRYAAKRRVRELAERFGTTAAEVRAKLDELELGAVDHQWSDEPDPGIESLEKGLASLYAKRYAQAEKQLSAAAEQAVQSEVANRARRYRAAARRQLKAKRKPEADPYLEAVYQRNQGNLEAALEICARGGRQSKDERFAHLAAAIHAVNGEAEKAARFLEVAIELNPKNRVLAYHDSDFAELREIPEYAGLFAASD